MRSALKILFLTVLSVLSIIGSAQDHISDIKAHAPLYFNPAYAGNEYFTRASLNYKNQYPTAGNSFSTYSGMFDIYFAKINSGFGLLLSSDKQGKAFTYNTANLSYSYLINTGESSFMRAGLSGNLFYGVRDPLALIFPDMIGIDGTILPNDLIYDRTTSFGSDFGAGVIFDAKKFEVGAAVFHLGNQKDLNNWHRPIKIHAHAEWRIPLFTRRTGTPVSDTWEDVIKSSTLNPSLYYWQQGKIQLWGIGANVRINVIHFSLFSRQDLKLKSQTAILGVGYASDVMEINYAFSMGFLGQTFKGMSASSHEICVTFRLPTNKEEY